MEMLAKENLSDINYISKDDFDMYLHVSDVLGCDVAIERLVDRVLERDFYNRNIVIVLANLLEDAHIELARICYEFIKNNDRDAP